MKKSKRHVKNFINYLFEAYKVPRIPVRVHWGYDVVETPGGTGFGVYIENADGSNPCIHVGCGKLGTGATMECIAHEFVHYMQHLHGRGWENIPALEEEAEYYAYALYNQYRINKKSKTMRVDGLADVWQGPELEGV